MIRVVIDTNVLVSGLLTSGGLPEAVINLAISGEVQRCASPSVLAEYEEVMKRRYYLNAASCLALLR